MSHPSRWLLPAMLGILLVPIGIIVVALRYDAAVSRVPRGASA
jgi:hypothetical protein